MIWDKLKQELDRAGKAAQGAIDEGKTRLEAFRARQQADKAAEALGYAVFRARQGGGEVDAQTYASLSATLEKHDTEARKLEEQMGGRVDMPPDGEGAGTGTSGTGTSGGTGGTGGGTSGSSYGSGPTSGSTGTGSTGSAGSTGSGQSGSGTSGTGGSGSYGSGSTGGGTGSPGGGSGGGAAF